MKKTLSLLLVAIMLLGVTGAMADPAPMGDKDGKIAAQLTALIGKGGEVSPENQAIIDSLVAWQQGAVDTGKVTDKVMAADYRSIVDALMFVANRNAGAGKGYKSNLIEKGIAGGDAEAWVDAMAILATAMNTGVTVAAPTSKYAEKADPLAVPPVVVNFAGYKDGETVLDWYLRTGGLATAATADALKPVDAKDVALAIYKKNPADSNQAYFKAIFETIFK